MTAGVRVVLRGLNSVRWNGYAYIWANLAFLTLSLPLVTLPAALSALFRVGHVSQTDPSEADLMLFWETFKANLGRATVWGLINVVWGGIVISNLVAYREVQGWGMEVLRLCWWGAVFLWLGCLLYTWSIFYEMEQPSLWGAMRNALLMTVTNPLFTAVILLSVLLVMAVSTVLAALWIVLTGATISAIANAAVLDRLTLYRKMQEVKSP